MLDLITTTQLARREGVAGSTIRRWVNLGWMTPAMGPPYYFDKDVQIVRPKPHRYCIECGESFFDSGRYKHRKFCKPRCKARYHNRKGKFRMQGTVAQALDWDTLAQVCRSTGKPVHLGVSGQFSHGEKIKMAQEARKRNLCISMGNHKRDPNERDDELYLQAKL